MGFKKLFQHNKFKHNIIKNKEIELENSNSDFIVVRHFLTYVHSPQALNRVRVPLTWSFNQASKLLYTCILAPMDSYTISSRFNSLEGFNTQFLQEWIPQPSSMIIQIQIKARMTHKGALRICKWRFNAPRKKWELLRQEQVGRQLIANVLYVINEVELSIYRFLTSRAKKNKKLS